MKSAKIATLADEIESFFNVLLWYAIRYLPHNCYNVDDFVYRYFDDSRKTEGDPKDYCGPKKLYAMKTGKLGVEFFCPQRVPSQSPPASHPLTLVIERLLEIFRSHYALNCVEDTFVAPVASWKPATGRVLAEAPDYDAWINEVEQDISPCFLEKKAETRVQRTPDQDQEWENGSEYEVELELDPAQESKRAQEEHRKPSQIKRGTKNVRNAKMQQDADILQSHEAIIILLVRYVMDPKLAWPIQDKTMDQLSEGYPREVDMERPNGESSRQSSRDVDETSKQATAKRKRSEGQPSNDRAATRRRC